MKKNLLKSISIAGAALTATNIALPILNTNRVSALSAQQSVFNDSQLNNTANSKDFYRKVYIKLPGKAPVLYQQSHIQFTRDLTQDVVTGQVTPGKWSTDQKLDAVEAPVYPGYSVDLKNVPAETITPNSKDESYTFTYTPVSQSVKIDFVNTNGTTLSSQTVSGKTGDTVQVPYNALKIPAGYRIKGGSVYPSSITFGSNKLNDYTIQVEPDTKLDGQETKTVTRKITIKTPGHGNQVVTQSATFTRNKISDPTTGKDSYSTWSNEVELPAYNAPELPGLTPDKKTINAVKVSGASNDSNETITYTANKQHVNINFMDGDKKIGTQTVNGVTGQDVNVALNIPSEYQIKGGQQIPSTVTFGSKPLSDINVQVISNKKANTQREKQDNERLNPEVQNLIAYQNDQVPDAKKVVTNYSALPMGTDVKWTNAPEMNKVGIGEATLLITYPDQTTTSVKIPYEIVKKQAGMHISTNPVTDSNSDKQDNKPTDNKSDDTQDNNSKSNNTANNNTSKSDFNSDQKDIEADSHTDSEPNNTTQAKNKNNDSNVNKNDSDTKSDSNKQNKSDTNTENKSDDKTTNRDTESKDKDFITPTKDKTDGDINKSEINTDKKQNSDKQTVHKSVLKDLVTKANNFIKDNKISDPAQLVKDKEIIANAQKVLDDSNATQDQITEQENNLKNLLNQSENKDSALALTQKSDQNTNKKNTSTDKQSNSNETAKQNVKDQNSYPEQQKDTDSYPDKASYPSRLPQTGENLQGAALGLTGVVMLGLTALGLKRKHD